jgi:hypothetical protein
MIGLGVAFLVLATAAGDYGLCRASYRYACWRVCHPFGPNVQAFHRIVALSTPARVPELIDRLDTPEGWWINSLLCAWFLPEQPAPTSGARREFWRQWWREHGSEHQADLALQYEPQF